MEWTSIIDCAYDAVITIGSEVDDTFLPTIQLKDFEGKNLTVPASIFAYLASDEDGLTPAATISGEVAKTAGGNGDVITLLTHCAYRLISEADGTISLTITEDDASNQYLVLVMPNGKLVVSDKMAFTT